MTPTNMSTLAAIAAGSLLYVTQDSGLQLVTDKMITVNPGDRDPNNPEAMRAQITELGQQTVAASAPQGQQQVTQPQAQVPPTPQTAAPVVQPVAQPQAAPIATPPVAAGPVAQQAAPVAAAPQVAPAAVTTATPAVAGAAPEKGKALPPRSSRKEFPVMTGIVKPAQAPKKRAAGGGNKSSYPYDQLEIGQCFFVGDGDYKSGNAFKAINSSVAGQNRKHKIAQVARYENDQPVYSIKLKKDGTHALAKDGSTQYVQIATKRFKAYKTDANHPSGPGALVYREALKETDVHLAAAPMAVAQG